MKKKNLKKKQPKKKIIKKHPLPNGKKQKEMNEENELEAYLTFLNDGVGKVAYGC